MAQYGLGRGLEALIPKKVTPPTPVIVSMEDGGAHVVATPSGVPLMVAVSAITVNDYQPRLDFDEAALEDLADSIREYGIIQPLVVSVRDEGGYLLIAGERRLRAAKKAGLREVPVVLDNADATRRAAIAIIENIQRVDLNPIETALAYKQLMDEFGFTQEEVAKKLGKSRPGIGNTLRLLNLHPEVQYAMRRGSLQEGHGKILAGLSLDEQAALLPEIIEQQMTVSTVTERVKQGLPATRHEPTMRQQSFDPILAGKEELLREHFGTKVTIARKRKGGAITIDFYSDDELRGILNKIIT